MQSLNQLSMRMSKSLTVPTGRTFTTKSLRLDWIHAAFDIDRIGLVASVHLLALTAVDLVPYTLTAVLTGSVQATIYWIDERQSVGLVFQAFI